MAVLNTRLPFPESCREISVVISPDPAPILAAAVATDAIERWWLTSVQRRLVKTGGRVVKLGR